MPFFPDRSFGPPARLLAAIAVFGVVSAGSAVAQTAPGSAVAQTAPGSAGTQTAPGSAGTQAVPDPVVATVNGQPIHASEVQATIESLPAQARSLPPQQLYPMLIDQLVDEQALVAEARKTGLDKDPDVARTVKMAEDRALASALLSKLVRPQVTEEAIKARYDQEFAGKPGEEEVHARHILVNDEATAKKIIAELKNGGDFAALSKQYSKDPGASAQGGDLGFFKKTDMVPAFADAAFALKDNEVTPVPVKTQFGWHVIQTLAHRTAAPPAFEQERDELRQQMVQAAVQKEVTQARDAATVVEFNMDGSPVKATDTAEPPPAK
jgi:peptidyl-prolyl cis-trans isomerase C